MAGKGTAYSYDQSQMDQMMLALGSAATAISDRANDVIADATYFTNEGAVHGSAADSMRENFNTMIATLKSMNAIVNGVKVAMDTMAGIHEDAFKQVIKANNNMADVVNQAASGLTAIKK